ncbi:energy transducer TonB [Mucilaginibacter sp.]|uniref:energy transducer TonB n=1 Tax=Mucilaginibacter sp. TaxID=1882438 RepID=UPI00326486B0
MKNEKEILYANACFPNYIRVNMKIKLYLTLLFSVAMLAAKAQTADTAKSVKDTVQVFKPVEVPPDFKGGFGKLLKFLSKNLKYPEKAREDNVQGRVIVSFVVERDGTLTGIKVIKSLSAETDAEALRLMAMSPAWNPGIQGGRPVRVQYSIPVSFNLSND